MENNRHNFATPFWIKFFSLFLFVATFIVIYFLAFRVTYYIPHTGMFKGVVTDQRIVIIDTDETLKGVFHGNISARINDFPAEKIDVVEVRKDTLLLGVDQGLKKGNLKEGDSVKVVIGAYRSIFEILKTQMILSRS
jgi:hypothetical protein